MKKIIIYTDGSSLGNPGAGGWGVIFLANNKVLEIGGKFEKATNNQMELWALKKAFEYLIEKNVESYQIDFMIDSKYTIDGITKWINSWIKNNWKKSDKKPVLNKEIWEEIYNAKKILEEKNQLNFIHVPAHKGEKFNERVDQIARTFASKEKQKLFKGSIKNYLML